MNKLFAKIPFLGLYKFSFFVFLGTFIIKTVVPQYVYHQIWVVLVFFVLLTLVSLYIIESLTKQNPDNFLAVYFSIMIGRLFLSIIFATIFILADRPHVFNFSINFMFLYLLFLGFEIYGIMTNLRPNNTNRSGNE